MKNTVVQTIRKAIHKVWKAEDDLARIIEKALPKGTVVVYRHGGKQRKVVVMDTYRSRVLVCRNPMSPNPSTSRSYLIDPARIIKVNTGE